MQTVLQLTFDKETDALFRSLWQAVKDAGLPNPMLDKPATPHITLSFGNNTDVDGLAKELSQTLKNRTSLELTFASLATFANEKGVIFAAPVVTAELLGLHRQTQACVLRHADSTKNHSEVDRWVPHCTLTMNLTPAEVVEGFKLFKGLQLPVHARGTYVRLLEFPSLTELAFWHMDSRAATGVL